MVSRGASLAALFLVELLPVFRRERFVVSQGTLHARQRLTNPIDRIEHRFRDSPNDLLRAELFEFFDGEDSQELKDLPSVIVVLEEHVELFFLRHQRPTERDVWLLLGFA